MKNYHVIFTCKYGGKKLYHLFGILKKLEPEKNIPENQNQCTQQTIKKKENQTNGLTFCFSNY